MSPAQTRDEPARADSPESSDRLDLDLSLIPAGFDWETATHGNGHVVLQLTLVFPDRQERRQIVLTRLAADELGRALRRVAVETHREP